MLKSIIDNPIVINDNFQDLENFLTIWKLTREKETPRIIGRIFSVSMKETLKTEDTKYPKMT
jgi:hypothetical protein